MAEALQIWVLMDRRLDFTALTALIELYDIEDPMLLIELLKELASKAATYR